MLAFGTSIEGAKALMAHTVRSLVDRGEDMKDSRCDGNNLVQVHRIGWRTNLLR